MSACEQCIRASMMRSEAMTLMEQRGLGPSEAARAMERPFEELLALLGGAADLSRAPGAGVWTVCRHDELFPPSLGQFERESDTPHALFGLGDRALLREACDQRSVAIVGARRASAYGREVAYSLANDAAASGLTVVSGMALGIDGAAHRGALQASGRTIAVLAGGPDRPYPRSHRLLYEQILAAGCVVSENPPGVEARRWAFVARNRIIAGMSAMSVWVEGAENSGARHTFDFADGLGLPVGVVPGPVTSPMSAGPNSMLGAEGVTTVRAIADVFDAIGASPAQLGLDTIATGEEGDFGKQILARIGAGERTPRDLALAFPERGRREILSALGRLELAALIVREPSGEYRREA